MQLLALAGLDGDLQHPHVIVFKEEAVIGRCGNHPIQVGRPFLFIRLRHAALQEEAHA
jgi:hypothetical protein